MTVHRNKERERQRLGRGVAERKRGKVWSTIKGEKIPTT